MSLEPEAMRAVLHRYLELVAAGDVDAVVDLMTDDVEVEDPVGGPASTHVVGRENVRAFFAAGFARARPRPTLTGAVRTTAGSEAAMPFLLTLSVGGREVEIDVVDVVRFDEQGRIASLRAFWNPAEMRDAIA